MRLVLGMGYLADATPIAAAQTVTLQNIYALPEYTPEEPTLGALIQGQDGVFYGIDASGAIFKITSSGSYTVLHQFPNFEFDGFPFAFLQGGDGNFYGAGKVTPSGDYSEFPVGGETPTMGSGGYYYTTYIDSGSGTNCDGVGCGQIVRFALDGTSSVVYSFTGGSDGGFPGGVMQASDGNLYGYSYVGGDLTCGGGPDPYNGTPGCGTLFKLTPTGTLTVLADLEAGEGQPTFPSPAAPIEAGDGNLYESIPGLSGSFLTIYKIALSSGKVSVLYTFPNSEGSIETLTPGPGNQIYGFTQQSVFDITTTGRLESEGSSDFLNSDLLLASDGNIYGNNGEIFRLLVTPPLTPPVRLSLSPNSVAIGEKAAISLKVNNAFSLSMQQCYGFQTLNGVMTPLGLVPGTYNSQTKLYTFTGSVPTTQPGTYTYAVTCGGIESGLATLTVAANGSTTTLTATPNPVTPPNTVALTATVTRKGGGGTPTGQVTFHYGALALGSATLNGSGVAVLNAATNGVPAGNYAVTCTYNGDGSDAASSSPAVTVTVE
jgi:hypothetical protein